MDFLRRPNVWIPLTAIAAGLALAFLFRFVLLHYARRRASALADTVTRYAAPPLYLLLPCVLGRGVQPLLDLRPATAPAVRHAVTLLIILSVAWLLIALI